MIALSGLAAATALLSSPYPRREGALFDRLFSTVIARECLDAPTEGARRALREFERAFLDGDLQNVDRLQDAARLAVDKALACSPAAGDLWMAGARLDALYGGLTPKAVSYLKMSCATTPTRAFDARGRLLLSEASGPQLTEDLKSCAARDRAIVASATRAVPAPRGPRLRK